MAHIVCVTSGLASMFNASMALAKQLEQAGHRITYASPGNLRQRVAAYDVAYVQLGPWAEIRPGDDCSWWQKLRTVQSRREVAVAALGVRDFGETMRSLNPDLLLIHNEMHPHIMAAVAAQLPVALLCTFLSIWKRPNLPPAHTSIVPGVGWRGQWYGIQWAWLRYSWQKWKAYQRDRLRQAGTDRISVLRCYAREIGYPVNNPFGHTPFGLTHWFVPYLHGPLPILCLNALEMDFPHRPHPAMRYVGPMIHPGRPEPQVEKSTYEALDTLFQQQADARAAGRGRSLIYCGCSTYANGDRLRLKKIVEAVSEQSEWDLVLGLGGKLKPEQLGPLPANVYAFDWAPQLHILPQADCAIVDAGSSAIRECVDAGVPMLLYSRGHDDQNGNQARAAYYGLGIAGDRQQDSVTEIRRHIRALLTDDTYRKGIHEMRDRCQRYRRENVAVKTVETLLPRSCTPPRVVPPVRGQQKSYADCPNSPDKTVASAQGRKN